MQEQQARYAIYFVAAPESDLHRFGSAVLGYDCYTGDELAIPHGVAKDQDAWRGLTEEPRRYGFHATLKAPFRLAAPRSEGELVGAFRDFAALPHPIPRFVPEVRLLGEFVALVPRDRGGDLVDLANRCTTAFDCFRAPMSTEERGRRIAAGLSERQLNNLDRWGYPYVFDDFRFHMTLTGSLPPDRRDAAFRMLRRSFGARCNGGPIAVDRLGLFKQEDARGRFRVLCAEPLRERSSTSSRDTPPFRAGR